MKIVKEVNSFEELYRNSCNGALDTLDDIARAHKEEELMNVLEETFADGDGERPTKEDVNDFLWFERDYIYERLELDENGEEIHDDEEDEEK